ncbi:MAG: hypothetical protein HY257_08165 [Chloroflexi bacterium]|nr:hypothetical protein [Chloroflexota bacterium]
MKLNRALIIAGVLALLVVDAAAAFNFGADFGRNEVRNTRLDFAQTRFGAQSTNSDQATALGTPNAQTGQRTQQAQQNQQGQNAQRLQTAQASGQIPQGFQNARNVTGTVKSVKGFNVELTAQDGSVINVTVDNQTQIQKTTTGTILDIKLGAPITVLSDQTGSTITARIIQVREQ